MAEEEPKATLGAGDGEAVEAGGDEESEPVSTPFDNPFFLPVLLWGMAAWFGYDIFTNAEAYQKYPNFNRGGFAVSIAAALWFTRSAILEKRDQKRDESDSEPA